MSITVQASGCDKLFISGCHAMPCHAMPCHAMPCHAMPCHAMPCLQAVTCEAFVEALAAANTSHGNLITGMLPWYDTPGTPTVTVSSSYSTASGCLTLTIKQRRGKRGHNV
jgi:hypothetical protein